MSITTNNVIRVGVIGLGKIAQIMHIPNLHTLENFHITALCDLSLETVNFLGDLYQVDPVHRYQDYRQLLMAPIDAVFILNSNHAPVILAAISARKHVFVEKPMCWNLREADEIIRATREHNVVVMVGYMKRYDPTWVEAQREFEKAGLPYLIRIHNFASGRHRLERLYPVFKPKYVPEELITTLDRELQASMSEALGTDDPRYLQVYRSFMELCSHNINLQRATFGSLEGIEHLSLFRVNHQLVYIAIMHHTSGARCVWEIAPFFDNAKKWDENLTVYTNEVTVAVRFGNPFIRHDPTTVWSCCSNGLSIVEQQILASYENPFLLELRHFAKCIETGNEPLTNVNDARTDVQFLIELTQSADIDDTWT